MSGVKIESKVQEPGKCYECVLPLDEDVKYYQEKYYHKLCFRRAVAKSNGLPYECPKCKGEGVEKSSNKHMTELTGLSITSIKCSLCSGAGFTAKKFVPVTEITGYVEE